jgi:large conductance mechanosensitive channel
MQYGHFLQEVLDFTIVAFAIFLMLKGINRLKRPAPHAKEPVPLPDDVRLLTEIRDLLKAKKS